MMILLFFFLISLPLYLQNTRRAYLWMRKIWSAQETSSSRSADEEPVPTHFVRCLAEIRERFVSLFFFSPVVADTTKLPRSIARPQSSSDLLQIPSDIFNYICTYLSLTEVVGFDFLMTIDPDLWLSGA